MDNPKRARFPSGLVIASGLWLMWIVNGPQAVGMYIVTMLVCFVGPFWLAAVYGKPHAERRRQGPRSSPRPST